MTKLQRDLERLKHSLSSDNPEDWGNPDSLFNIKKRALERSEETTSGLPLERLEMFATRWKQDIDWLRTLPRNEMECLLLKETQLLERARLRQEAALE